MSFDEGSFESQYEEKSLKRIQRVEKLHLKFMDSVGSDERKFPNNLGVWSFHLNQPSIHPWISNHQTTLFSGANSDVFGRVIRLGKASIQIFWTSGHGTRRLGRGDGVFPFCWKEKSSMLMSFKFPRYMYIYIFVYLYIIWFLDIFWILTSFIFWGAGANLIQTSSCSAYNHQHATWNF